jgi:NADP-dependent 3-hydroxy acid dehydrogenase YdfG
MAKSRALWVTGGGSGMGRAAAVAAAEAGWRVAVSGRRVDSLDQTVRLVREAGGEAIAVPVDVRSRDELAVAHRRIVDAIGPVTGLVLAAGLNSPRRAWGAQSMYEFAAIVETNLTSVAATIELALPGMRAARSGTVVVLSSRAAWRFSPGSGVAYMASKSAVGALVASLNEAESPNGVRACHLCPGDVDTEFLELRPSVPDAAQRKVMLTPADIGRVVRFVLDSPAHVRIDELVISPVSQHDS